MSGIGTRGTQVADKRLGAADDLLTVAISTEALDESQRTRAASAFTPGTRVLEIDESATSYRHALANADVVVGWPAPGLLSRASRARVVQLASAGYEDYLAVDVEGLVICNAAGVGSPAVAEHCLALMLTMARRIPEHLRDQGARRWQRLGGYRELGGTTTCIVGTGDVGREVARRCRAFGMRVVGVARVASAPAPDFDELYPVAELKRAVAAADFVIVALPGGEETRSLLDADSIAAVKPGAYLVSVGRGTVLDQDALVEALGTGRIAGAGIDVWDPEPPGESSPLWKLENVIVTSHSAGLSSAIQLRLCRLVIENVGRFERAEGLLNQVIPRVRQAALS